MIESLGDEEGLEGFKSSNKVALIDCDTVIYAACSGHEYAEDLMPEDFYSGEEYRELLEHPNYDAEENCIWYLDEDAAWDSIVTRISDIQTATDTKSVELYFTSGRNFRYTVDPMYKANRKNTRYPVGLSLMKDKALENYAGEICTEYEADDIVVMLKRTQPKHYILAAIDKDVLGAVPGKHYNYYRSFQYNIEPKWVTTDIESAMKFPYKQTLMGDTTDNIKGCPGIGPKRADKILANSYLPCEMWKLVVKTFLLKKLTVKDAIRDMRLVQMNQLSIDRKITLWEPPCEF